MPDIDIQELTSQGENLWDEYVKKSQNSTVYHLIAWKNVIENSLGHKPYYLLAKRNGIIVGILPLFLVKSILFGRHLVSVPAANYGGVCADSEEIGRKLVAKAYEITKELRVDFLELRNAGKNNYGLKEDTSHVTFLIPLERNPEEVWRRFHSNVKKNIKKAMRSTLDIYWEQNGVDDFYDVYCSNMKQLGSPPFPIEFFEAILREFPDGSELVFLKHKGKVIASNIVVYFKDRVMPLFIGAYKEYLKFCPNNFIYWKEIEKACREGYRYYDFGRSQRNSGTFNFKKYWGGQLHQLYYCYYLNKKKKIPKRSPLCLKYRLSAKIWRRLPLNFTKYMGPKVVKYLF